LSSSFCTLAAYVPYLPTLSKYSCRKAQPDQTRQDQTRPDQQLLHRSALHTELVYLNNKPFFPCLSI